MAPAMPVIGFVNAGSEEASASYVAAFRKGLAETGYVEGQNVTVEYHWLEGQFESERRYGERPEHASASPNCWCIRPPGPPPHGVGT
jgi:hypothetical protein